MTSTASELIRLPALKVLELLQGGEVTPLDLLDELEARIASCNPAVNALPTLCLDRARNAAQQLLARDAAGRGSMMGLPVPIKDLTAVSGVRTTRGSALFRDHVPADSDYLVENIENSGGIIYAKSNTPEFGTGGNTYNKVFGATRNPWDLEMSVAGSSGGAAAALATGMAWLAHGSDMGGSLRNPASFCGVVGLRPTPGRIISGPDSQVFDTLSTSGPMARNVEDLAFFLDVMCGPHPLQPLQLESPGESGFLGAARRAPDLKKVAFSMDLGITPVDPQVRSVVESAVTLFDQAGVVVEEATPDFSGVHEIFHVLRALSYASCEDLLECDRDELNRDVVWNIEQGLGLTPADIVRAESARAELVRRVLGFFEDYDLIVTPATVVPPYSLEHRYVAECNGHRFDNYYQWLSIAYAFTTAMCPAIAIPGGFTDSGLPVGIQVAARPCGEQSLLSAARYFEQILAVDNGIPIDPASH